MTDDDKPTTLENIITAVGAGAGIAVGGYGGYVLADTHLDPPFIVIDAVAAAAGAYVGYGVGPLLAGLAAAGAVGLFYDAPRAAVRAARRWRSSRDEADKKRFRDVKANLEHSLSPTDYTALFREPAPECRHDVETVHGAMSFYRRADGCVALESRPDARNYVHNELQRENAEGIARMLRLQLVDSGYGPAYAQHVFRAKLREGTKEELADAAARISLASKTFGLCLHDGHPSWILDEEMRTLETERAKGFSREDSGQKAKR